MDMVIIDVFNLPHHTPSSPTQTTVPSPQTSEFRCALAPPCRPEQRLAHMDVERGRREAWGSRGHGRASRLGIDG